MKSFQLLIILLISTCFFSCTRYAAICIGTSPDDARIENADTGECISCGTNYRKRKNTNNIVYRKYVVPVKKGTKYLNVVAKKDNYSSDGQKIPVKARRSDQKALNKVQGTYHLDVQANCKRKPIVAQSRVIKVSSEPSGAAVFVNGEYQGNTNLTLTLTESCRVSIEKTGYKSKTLASLTNITSNWHVVLQPVTREMR